MPTRQGAHLPAAVSSSCRRSEAVPSRRRHLHPSLWVPRVACTIYPTVRPAIPMCFGRCLRGHTIGNGERVLASEPLCVANVGKVTEAAEKEPKTAPARRAVPWKWKLQSRECAPTRKRARRRAAQQDVQPADGNDGDDEGDAAPPHSATHLRGARSTARLLAHCTRRSLGLVARPRRPP